MEVLYSDWSFCVLNFKCNLIYFFFTSKCEHLYFNNIILSIWYISFIIVYYSSSSSCQTLNTVTSALIWLCAYLCIWKNLNCFLQISDVIVNLLMLVSNSSMKYLSCCIFRAHWALDKETLALLISVRLSTWDCVTIVRYIWKCLNYSLIHHVLILWTISLINSVRT